MATDVKFWLIASKMEELWPFSYFCDTSETYQVAILEL